MPEPFQVGVSADFQTDAAGRLEPALDAIFDPLPQIAYRYFEPSGQDAQGAVVTPADIAGFWRPLLELLAHMRFNGFIRAELEVRYLVAERIEDVLPMMQAAATRTAVTRKPSISLDPRL